MIETVNIKNGYLRPLTLSDSAFIQTLFNDSAVKKFFVLRAEHAQDINLFTRFMVQQMERSAAINYIIMSNMSQAVGLITAELTRHPRTNNLMWNMSIAIAPQYRKHGYATNATIGMTDFLLNTFTVDQVSLDISQENVDSISVAEKCGFKKPSEPGMRIGYVDPEHMELGLRMKWFKSLDGKRPMLFNQAADAFRRKDYITSIRLFEKALEEPCQPGSPVSDAQIYSNMGMAYSSLRQYQEAFKYLKKAQAMGLTNASIERELAWLRNNVGLY